MARSRNPSRDQAKKEWLESDGKLTHKQLAEAHKVPESRIRKWKSEDGWKAALEDQQSRRKRGGQPGNKNAAGAGAPKRNSNAVTHGAYATVYFDELNEEERAAIEAIDLDAKTNMLRELQTLIAKENDLMKRIATLERAPQDELYVDKVIDMQAPSGKQGDAEGEEGGLKTTLQTTIKASPFDRAMKLRTELDKTHGRIIRLLDAIKAYEIETRRLSLEEKKYRLAKQKMQGAFEVDPDTGEINDDYDADETEDGDGIPV